MLLLFFIPLTFFATVANSQNAGTKKAPYFIRADAHLLFNVKSIQKPNALYDSDKYVYGMRIVNGVGIRKAEAGLGLGLEKWKEPVFTGFVSYLQKFDLTYAPWFCFRMDGGLAFGKMNPEQPYPENDSNKAWFLSLSPLARIKISNAGLLILGIQYEIHKIIMPEKSSIQNYPMSHFLGLSGGISFR